MAVTYVQEDNPLNAVGGLMTLGGAFIPNAGLLAPLGMGVSATTGGLNPYQTTMLGKIMDNVMTGKGNAWMNPAKNTTAKTSRRGYSW